MEKLSCDGGHEFKLLLSCSSGLSPSLVSVVFDEAYDRIPHPDPTLEQSISESDLENMASKMPGCHRGGYALYKLMVQCTTDS